MERDDYGQEMYQVPQRGQMNRGPQRQGERMPIEDQRRYNDEYHMERVGSRGNPMPRQQKAPMRYENQPYDKEPEHKQPVKRRRGDDRKKASSRSPAARQGQKAYFDQEMFDAPKRKEPQRIKAYACDACMKGFDTLDGLIRHQESTGHMQGCACEVCEKYFETDNALERHQIATGHFLDLQKDNRRQPKAKAQPNKPKKPEQDS
jgi:hypothetical protein